VIVAVQVERALGTFRLDVAFEAPAGITALFGPSGSGKTLTLRSIAGLLRPDRGRIAVAGRTLFDSAGGVDVPPRQRHIGYVFQHYALFPHLDAAANVAYGIAHLPRDRRGARVSELLEMVALSDAAHRPPRELSGGEQQRIALARALAPGPDLVLLDEPFAAVDSFVRGRLRDQLRAIQERTGIPMILVTHDASDVAALAETVVLYGRGKVLESGPTGEVLAHARPDARAYPA